MNAEDLKGIIHCDPEIMGGTPVFAGTRVPLQNLIDSLEGGESIEDFLEGFPAVQRGQVLGSSRRGSCGCWKPCDEDFPLRRGQRTRYDLPMTVEQLKAEAAKLPPDDRFALAEWIEQNEDLRELRHAALVREIETGLGQLERGECVECKDDAELGAFFDGVKARGRELLAARKKSAA